jgi:predicted lactoylglutathione lyase
MLKKINSLVVLVTDTSETAKFYRELGFTIAE